MPEHRIEEIDRSNMMIVEMPGSGEQVWVIKPDNYVDPSSVKPIAQPAQVAGQNYCTHCGQYFQSANVLRDHVRRAHPIASGQADMALVEMPDGTMVPADAIPELVRQKQDAAISKGKAREAELEAKLEELAAKLAELSQKPAAKTIKAAKDK